MDYNLQNPLAQAQLRLAVEKAIASGETYSFTRKNSKRSLNQNSYIHVLFGYFATQTGNTAEWVKQEYFKKIVNPDYFYTEVNDRFLGIKERWKSTSELTMEEMSICIERFRNWAANEAEIYLPSADEKDLLDWARKEIENHKHYI